MTDESQADDVEDPKPEQLNEQLETRGQAQDDLETVQIPTIAELEAMVREEDSAATMLRPDAPDVPAVPVNLQISGYDLFTELGRGGMGVVYKARDQKLKRIVALKMILSGAHASDEDMQRFQTEAEAVAKLQHPNIVQIFEVGEYEGRPFLALEFVDGGSLDQRIAGTPQNTTESAGLVDTLARAIQYAHNNGIIHRDLKPANILLTTDGEPRITDFGLAKRMDEDSSNTKSGSILGTPSYMAPEQAGSSSATLGPTADVYALGAILYHMLTGRPPFQAETQLDTIMQVIGEEPVAPRRLNSGIPLDLDTIALKCLEKDPRRRYPSAADLSEDLRRWLDGRPIMSRPVNWLEHSWRWCKRKPVVAALSIAVISLLMIGTIISSYFGIMASREAQLADAARLQAEEREKTAHRYAYDADMFLTQVDWGNANTERMVETLSRYNDDPIRGFEWYYWNRLCGDDQETFTMREHFFSVNAVAFNSDATEIATASGYLDSSIIIWNAAKREKRIRIDDIEDEDGVGSIAFSPDDALIIVGLMKGNVRIWRTDDGTLLRSLDLHEGEVTGVCLHPDGTLVASCSDDDTVKIWELSSGQVRTTITSEFGFNSVDFHPDGTHLLTSGNGAAAHVWDVESGREELLLDHEGPVYGAAFSPSGDRIVTGCGNLVRLWNAEDGEIIHEMPGHRFLVGAVAFSPDGTTVASGGHDNSVRLWEAATGVEKRLLKGHTGAIQDLRFSATGEALVSASDDGTARVHDLTTSRESVRHEPGKAPAEALAVSPDGTRLLTQHDIPFSGTKVQLSSLATGKVVWTRTHKDESFGALSIGGEPHRLGFSPDGSLVVYLQGKHVVIADSRTGKSTSVLKGHRGAVMSVVFDRLGQLIATASSFGEAKIWSVHRGRELVDLGSEVKDVEGLHFLGDGKNVLVSSGLMMDSEIFNATTGEKKRSLDLGGPCVAASPDTMQIAVGTMQNTIAIWNAKTGKKTTLLSGHVDTVRQVAFGPGGSRLLSTSDDGTVRLWDLATGREVLTFEPNIGAIQLADFSHNGNVIVVVGEAGEIVAWDCGSRTAERRTDVPARYRVFTPPPD